MTPYEILLSESQERMLLVAKPGKEARVLAICEKWDLDAAVIGKVTDTKRWVVKATPGYDPLADRARRKRAPVVVCDIPIGVLTDDAPVYDRPRAAARRLARDRASTAARSRSRATSGASCSTSCGSPERRLARVGVAPVRPDRARRDRRAPRLATRRSCACRARRTARRSRSSSPSPSTATAACASSTRSSARAMAIAEVCRNLVCSGAEPIGITDCLNFGNPERPEVMEQFARAIDGIAAACNALGVPDRERQREPLQRDATGGERDPADARPSPRWASSRDADDVVTHVVQARGRRRASCSATRRVDGRARARRERVARAQAREARGRGAARSTSTPRRGCRSSSSRSRARSVLASAHDVSRRRPRGRARRVLRRRRRRGETSARGSSCRPAGASPIDALARSSARRLRASSSASRRERGRRVLAQARGRGRPGDAARDDRGRRARRSPRRLWARCRSRVRELRARARRVPRRRSSGELSESRVERDCRARTPGSGCDSV